MDYCNNLQKTKNSRTVDDNIFIFCFFFYNRFYLRILSDNSKYIELNSDVPLQWLDITSMIYDNNYFYALDNNLIEGQGLLISYIQSIILKINFNTETFIFINNNYNLVFLISFLLIFDTNLTKKINISLLLHF